MRLSIPKQFVLLAGKPVLMHTLAAFGRCSFPVRIVLVLPDAEITTWEKLCRRYSFNIIHEVVAGGATRSASVANGLTQLDREEGLVAVHDGVRPLVTTKLIERSYQLAEKYGSAVASVPLKDSIRRVDETKSEACPREQYRLVQTPQTFRTKLLRNAYNRATAKEFSDDASLVEHAGYFIHLMEGEYQNLKITTPEDLMVAEVLIKQTEVRQ